MTHPAPTELPDIISVDDHLIEPPDLWRDDAPASLANRVPRVERGRARFTYRGGVFSAERCDDDETAAECDWWVYDGTLLPTTRVASAMSWPIDERTMEPATFDEMRPGCFDPRARLADMDLGGIGASVCFPTMPRFCGQTFSEAEDRDLALWCVQRWNDWVLDEWCGTDRARLLPLSIVPLWDPKLAAAEVRRMADRGAVTVAFSENPAALGLPSIHSGLWDPFIAACDETDTVVSMHIGSSSKMPSTSADAPPLVASSLTHLNAVGTMCDWILSGTFERFEHVRIALSEGQVGWMPFQLERLDQVWAHNRAWGGVELPSPPSSYVAGRIYGCIFDDRHGLANRDVIGMEQIMFETDFPHADSTWPNCRDVAAALARDAALDDREAHALVRGNAVECYRLDRLGIAP